MISSQKDSRIIWLCVGNKNNVFQLTQETLERSKYLHEKCEGKLENNSEVNPFFIDKDGELFGGVLKFLRNPRSAIPSELRAEIQSYNIEKMPIQYTKKDIIMVGIFVFFILWIIRLISSH